LTKPLVVWSWWRFASELEQALGVNVGDLFLIDVVDGHLV
jgi:hypothetical protein